jgi:hypothetical protein
VLCCGTLRIAVDSFDTDPAPEFQAEIWEWVCETLNNAQNTPAEPPQVGSGGSSEIPED